MNFTDSKLEWALRQNRGERHSAPDPPRLPAGHPCAGCPYPQDRPCVGICLRTLLSKENGGKENG